MIDKVKKVKIQNVIDMAFLFTAMGRIFESGSAKKIKAKLSDCMNEFLNVHGEKAYHKKHEEFCEWFTENIRTAERKKKEKIIKKSKNASWGQAAKVIDIVLKVCIYYCHFPSPEASSKIVPWLNGAIDTPLLKDLRNRYSSLKISKSSAIADIDKEKYEELQKIIRIDIEEWFGGEIFPVQYDDIKWRELNR